MQTQLLVKQFGLDQNEQVSSDFADNKRFAFLDAHKRTWENIERITAEQFAKINTLYALVCSAYNSVVYKNVRKTCATIKVAEKNASVNIHELHDLMQFCKVYNISLQNNINTNSISFVLKY